MESWTAIHGGHDTLARCKHLNICYQSTCYAYSDVTYLDYPWDTLPAGTRVCDIGGNKGYVSMALLQKHAHLKVIVQDLPNVIEDAKKVRPSLQLTQVVTFVLLLTSHQTVLGLGGRHGWILA